MPLKGRGPSCGCLEVLPRGWHPVEVAVAIICTRKVL
jgi:hypothetical protein